MRDYSYTLGRLPELKKQLEKVEDHMSDKGYEVAPLEDIPKRNDPWDECKPDKEKTMNERIKELLNVCGMPNEDLMEIYSDINKSFYMEKFAELIVRECAQYMYEHYPHSRYEINYMRKHMGDADWNKPIKEHFGVEE
jgi:hypothetical protein